MIWLGRGFSSLEQRGAVGDHRQRQTHGHTDTQAHKGRVQVGIQRGDSDQRPENKMQSVEDAALTKEKKTGESSRCITQQERLLKLGKWIMLALSCHGQPEQQSSREGQRHSGPVVAPDGGRPRRDAG